MNDAKFDIETIGDHARRVCPGEVLDNSNADVFSGLLMSLYSNDIRFVMIDMKRLGFLSSAGVGSILGTVELFREKEGDIVLTNLSDKIYRILEVLNLDEYLTLCKSAEAARAKCGV